MRELKWIGIEAEQVREGDELRIWSISPDESSEWARGRVSEIRRDRGAIEFRVGSEYYMDDLHGDDLEIFRQGVVHVRC